MWQVLSVALLSGSHSPLSIPILFVLQAAISVFQRMQNQGGVVLCARQSLLSRTEGIPGSSIMPFWILRRWFARQKNPSAPPARSVTAVSSDRKDLEYHDARGNNDWWKASPAHSRSTGRAPALVERGARAASVAIPRQSK